MTIPFIFTARAVGVGEHSDIDVLSVGVAEQPNGTGHSLVFQVGYGGAAEPDVTNGFSLVTERGDSVEAGVKSLKLTEGALKIGLLSDAATTLGLSEEFGIRLDLELEQF